MMIGLFLHCIDVLSFRVEAISGTNIGLDWKRNKKILWFKKKMRQLNNLDTKVSLSICNGYCVLAQP